MIVTAVLAIRNDAPYLANCLRHLVRNDIPFAVIDNDSNDASAAIYRRAEFAAHLVDVRTLPYDGSFSLRRQLAAKTELIAGLQTDWVIHLDADEIMHSTRARETLHEAIERLAAGGSNVVDFDEFVFLPVDRGYESDTDGEQPLTYYYYYSPNAPRLMRAWAAASGLVPADGGHRLSGGEIRLAPERLALRHYIVRDRAHARRKYTERTFDAGELAAGWHRARTGRAPEAFELPPAERLKRLARPQDRIFDVSEPWSTHYWDWP